VMGFLGICSSSKTSGDAKFSIANDRIRVTLLKNSSDVTLGLLVAHSGAAARSAECPL